MRSLSIYFILLDFEWESLNFGWTLADVVRRTKELRLLKAQKESCKENDIVEVYEKNDDIVTVEEINQCSKKRDDYEATIEESSDGEPFMEIGTWSNDMAGDLQTYSSGFNSDISTFGGMVSCPPCSRMQKKNQLN